MVDYDRSEFGFLHKDTFFLPTMKDAPGTHSIFLCTIPPPCFAHAAGYNNATIRKVFRYSQPQILALAGAIVRQQQACLRHI